MKKAPGFNCVSVSSRLRLISFLIALTLISTTLLRGQTTPPIGIRSKSPDARAFINGKITVSPEMTVENGTLIIKDGKVLDVGKADEVNIPPDIFIIDLEGRSIFPGFIDAFTDYGVEKTERVARERNRPPQYEAKRIGGDAWNEAIHAEKSWSLRFKPDEDESRQFIELGFTAVLSAKKDGILRGRSCIVLTGGGLPNDLLIKPNGYHIGSFSKGSSTQAYPSSLMGSIALIRQTLYDVDWYRKAGRAYKLNADQKMPEFNSAIEALADLENEKIIFDGGDNAQSLFRVKRLFDEFGVPVVHVGGGHEYMHIDEVKSTGVTLILPLNFPEAPSIKSLEDELDVTLAQLRHWETAPSNPARLAANDISFALTTHRLKKKSDFWKNLRLAVKRGLSKSTALAALTTVPAGICGIDDMTGSLEKGKLANFIICDGDIFEKEGDIYSVWIAGNKHDLKPIPTTDFRGEYTLNVDRRELVMIIKGRQTEPQGEIKIEDKSEKLRDIDIDRNKISFSAKLDSVKTAGIDRFSGRFENDTISGPCLLTDGRTVDWTAIKIGPVPEEADTSEAKPPREDDSLIANLTYPNKAFGLAVSPVVTDILIKNATVWTVEDEGILDKADILIKDGRFARIGRDLTAPSGVEVMDATGKHISPGIIDIHSHIAGDGDLNEGTFAITPEVRIGDVIDPSDINIYRQLAGGVTGCLTLHGSANPIGGQCQVIKHRWGSGAEELKFVDAAPTLKFALGENVKQSNWGERFTTRYPQSRMGVKTIMEDEFQAAIEYEAEWEKYNALDNKQKQRTVPPRKDIRLDAIVEVLHSERRVHCHAYVQSETLMMMRLAEKFGFKIDVFVHNLDGYKVASEMAEHGAGSATFSDWWAYKFEVYDAIPYNAALLTERGVLTTMKSDDADLARRLNQEAGKAVMYGGMSREEAIKLVTINAAELLGADHKVGSIRVGKDADFVIWSDSPLSIYARAEQTWIEGKKYFDIEEDMELRRANRDERNALIQKVLKTTGKGKDYATHKKKKRPGRGLDVKTNGSGEIR